jgi:pilus assembly protein CpaE
MSHPSAPPSPADLTGELIAPVPRVTLQAFCETHDVAAVIQAAISDRRMQKAVSKVQMGGPAAAVEAFRSAPTPNVLILEQTSDRSSLIESLDHLAEVCDPGTRVLVIGHVNDILLYRELTRKGVSEYLIAPLGVIDIVRAVSELFHAEGSGTLGRTIAVMGARGGVGASTIAHNLAWSVAQSFDAATVLVDLDLAFGTAGLDFNQDPPQGVADALFAPDRLDQALLDRLLSRCSDNLSLLAAPAVLDRDADLAADGTDMMLDLLRGMAPNIVLDVPHLWSGWTRRVLTIADELIVVATPDLASLRNAKNLIDVARQARVNDRPPHLVLTQTGLPKRPEIAPAEFAKSLGMNLSATFAFDAALYGAAANNGQMIAELQPGGPVAQQYNELAALVLGRQEAKKSKRNLLEPLLARFVKRKAS